MPCLSIVQRVEFQVERQVTFAIWHYRQVDWKVCDEVDSDGVSLALLFVVCSALEGRLHLESALNWSGCWSRLWSRLERWAESKIGSHLPWVESTSKSTTESFAGALTTWKSTTKMILSSYLLFADNFKDSAVGIQVDSEVGIPRCKQYSCVLFSGFWFGGRWAMPDAPMRRNLRPNPPSSRHSKYPTPRKRSKWRPAPPPQQPLRPKFPSVTTTTGSSHHFPPLSLSPPWARQFNVI